MNQLVKSMIGRPPAHQAFQATWGKELPPQFILNGFEAPETSNFKNIIRANPNWSKDYQHYTAKAIADMRQKAAMTMSGVSSAIPIIFDPEVISILKSTAPVMDWIDTAGYQGYTVRANNISARDDPNGWTSEANSFDLSSVANGVTLSTVSSDMEIYTDAVTISDFGQMGSAHYMDLRETTLGERVAIAGQWIERTILYGDSSGAGSAGDMQDSDTFDGCKKIFTDASQAVDRSQVAGSITEDIKGYINTLFQSENNIMAQDLAIWVSWTMYDHLEHENADSYGRWDINDGVIRRGEKQITIEGVPVYRTHNIRELSVVPGGGATTTGDPGDVFILNSRALKKKDLAPLSLIPLARLGLADRMGLFTFTTIIDRSDGAFGYYLYDYPIQ